MIELVAICARYLFPQVLETALSVVQKSVKVRIPLHASKPLLCDSPSGIKWFSELYKVGGCGWKADIQPLTFQTIELDRCQIRLQVSSRFRNKLIWMQNVFHELELYFMSIRSNTRGLIEKVRRKIPICIFRLNKCCATNCNGTTMLELDLKGCSSVGIVRLIWLKFVQDSSAILIKCFIPPFCPIKIELCLISRKIRSNNLSSINTSYQ